MKAGGRKGNIMSKESGLVREKVLQLLDFPLDRQARAVSDQRLPVPVPPTQVSNEDWPTRHLSLQLESKAK